MCGKHNNLAQIERCMLHGYKARAFAARFKLCIFSFV